MPRRVLVLLGFLVVFLGAVLMVTLRRQPPEIPADQVHRALGRDPETCLACHGPGGARPRGPNHPFGKECWRCHYEVGEAR